MGILERLTAVDIKILGRGGRSRYDRGMLVINPRLDRDLDELRARVAELERRLSTDQ